MATTDQPQLIINDDIPEVQEQIKIASDLISNG